MSAAVEIKYYVGDVGTTLVVSTGNNLTTATLIKLKVQKPDGTEHTWDAIINPALNTQILYTVVAGDLDQLGTYKVQAYVEFPSGKWRGNTASFKVVAHYK